MLRLASVDTQNTSENQSSLPTQGVHTMVWLRTDAKSCSKRTPIGTGFSNRKNDSEESLPSHELHWDTIDT